MIGPRRERISIVSTTRKGPGHVLAAVIVLCLGGADCKDCHGQYGGHMQRPAASRPCLQHQRCVAGPVSYVEVSPWFLPQSWVTIPSRAPRHRLPVMSNIWFRTDFTGIIPCSTCFAGRCGITRRTRSGPPELHAWHTGAGRKSTLRFGQDLNACHPTWRGSTHPNLK